jgi:hypothetical protein
LLYLRMGCVGTLTQTPRSLAPRLTAGASVWARNRSGGAGVSLGPVVWGGPRAPWWDAIGPETGLDECTGPVQAMTPGQKVAPGS